MIADERNGGTEPRRAIDYQYSDRFEEEEGDGLESGRAIEGAHRGIDVLPGQPNRSQQAGVENEWARE